MPSSGPVNILVLNVQWISTIYKSNWFFRAHCPPELDHQRVQWSVKCPLTFNRSQCLPWRQLQCLRCWIIISPWYGWLSNKISFICLQNFKFCVICGCFVWHVNSVEESSTFACCLPWWSVHHCRWCLEQYCGMDHV